MGVLDKIIKKLNNAYFDVRVAFAHSLHQKLHREDYQYISQVLEKYHSYGGLKHRFQFYKLFELTQLLNQHKPTSILELGAGSSTAIFVKYVSQLSDDGSLYSIDESKKWLDVAKKIANVRDNKNDIKFLHANKVYKIGVDLVEAKYDINLSLTFDLIFIDGPSLRINGVKYKNGINTNIFDISDKYLPKIIVVDVRKSTVNEIVKRLGTYYEYTISDLFSRRIYLNYNYFSIFRKKKLCVRS